VDVIQEVGSYAGFAAVIGLAVLSALYFSQGRDVRRLREWAGRAPERAAEQAAQQAMAPEQAAQEAARPAASGAVRPIPAVKPAGPKPAEAEKPGAPGQPTAPGKPGEAKPGEPAKPEGPAKEPAGPTPAPATAAGDKKAAPGPAAAPPVPATAAATASKPAAGPAPATPAAAPAKGAPPAPAKPSGAPVSAPAVGSPPPARPPAVPARPGPVARSPAAAAAAQNTAVMPVSSSARLRDRARRGGAGAGGLSPRYIALIVAGVIVIGGGVAFGIAQLGGDDEGGGSGGSAQQAPQEPVNPSTVTVSVLNGTTVPGLAAQIGDEVESSGFQRGNVANALDQQRTTSVVLYAEGADREAKLVARRLGINAVEPIDPDSQALGGNASVVVIVGADQTS
jgi:hypothetical protein